MPSDYTFHKTIGRKLRDETANWANDRTETRPQFIARVERAYDSLTEAQIRSGCGSVVTRLASLHASDGDTSAKN